MVVRTAIDDVLEQAVTSGAIPGLVAMAADANGVVYEGAFGKREVGGKTDVTLDTVFWIASMTKAVTSVSALQLVEQGKLALDEPIGRVLPEIADPQVFNGWDANGAPTFQPAARPVTLRHLLTHTSGFVYPNWNGDMKRYAEYVELPQNAGRGYPRRDAVMMFEPGDRWEYSTSTDWVGRAVEAASGQDLDAYMRDHIFAPLGMSDTGFIPNDEQVSRLVSRHQRTGPASFDVIPVNAAVRPTGFNGGGGLFSVGRDYLTFLRMLLAGGSMHGARILKPETVGSLYENNIGDLEAGILNTANPQMSYTANFFPAMVKKWGLAGLLNPDQAPTGRSAGSLAWAGLYNTYFWIDPTRKVTGLIMTQILPFADPIVVDVFGQFERAVYDMTSI
jgi:CubicO group peptidase (beta-lactamase class C family)